MSKRLSKHINSFDYFDKSLIVLLVTTGSISIASFVIEKVLETMQNGKKNHIKLFVLARTKLNSIESKISKALINNENSHKGFLLIINEEKDYRELKESIRMMTIHRSNTEKIISLKKVKKEVLMKLLNTMNLLIAV